MEFLTVFELDSDILSKIPSLLWSLTPTLTADKLSDFDEDDGRTVFSIIYDESNVLVRD